MSRIPYDGCPLCASKDTNLHCTADTTKHARYQTGMDKELRWLHCRACEHSFTEGYAPTGYFTENQGHAMVGEGMEASRNVSGRIVERIAGMIPPPAKWLDVGFGNGSLLFTAEEFGYNVVGLDTAQRNVSDISARGIESYCDAIEDFDPKDQKFEVISMCDVLEHTPFPHVPLVRAKEMMLRRGILFISCPSYKSPVWRELDRQRANPYWQEIEHNHNFSRDSLIKLVEDRGFSFCEYSISQRYRVGMELLFIRD